MAGPMRRVRAAADGRGVPVIYANDNFGRWHASFGEIYGHCVRAGSRGREVVRKLNAE